MAEALSEVYIFLDPSMCHKKLVVIDLKEMLNFMDVKYFEYL